MLTVLLSRAQKRLHKLLLLGGRSLSTLCAESEALALSGNSLDLVLVSCAHFSKIVCENAAFIARTPQDLPETLVCARAVIVMDSSNSALREAVALRRLPALTCGRSDTDSFTLTSLTSDSAVVSLSRPICAFDKSLVEPFELPVSFAHQTDPFDLLAAVAVFCLLGEQNPLSSQKKWMPDVSSVFAAIKMPKNA